MKKIFLLIAFTIIISNSYAQKLDGWKIKGQIQLRTEVDGRDFSNETHPLTFASLRTRLGVEKTFANKLQFVVQFQDSRVFGEETNPNLPIDNIDLHQGFVKFMKPFDLDVDIQAGRFEVVYGTERFLGSSNWSYTGRAYDGVRFSILPTSWDIDLFALTMNESVRYIPAPLPALYPYPQTATPSTSLYGFYKKNNITDNHKFDLVGYYEINREDVAPDTNRFNTFTFGGTYWANFGDLSTTLEAGYQLGQRLGVDVGAYLISLQGMYKTGITSFSLGADFLSGNNPDTDDKNETYLPTYGTGHKFFGYMDYFPVHFFGYGVNDFYLKANINPSGSPFSFAVDLHHFMSNQSIMITTSEKPDGSEQNTFGQELDLTIRYSFIENTFVTWGGSLFFPGDLMKAIYDPREDAAFWTYLMITANL